ncbi:50S ribosomal protein L32 [Candidatus Hodgkinia cicadicola]|nr:50S ribosomal protein L32 [Candidatus Hodgkinia cicadicola]
MTAPKKRVSLSKRGFKQKRLTWNGLKTNTRPHHVDLLVWEYKSKRLPPILVNAFY